MKRMFILGITLSLLLNLTACASKKANTNELAHQTQIVTQELSPEASQKPASGAKEEATQKTSEAASQEAKQEAKGNISVSTGGYPLTIRDYLGTETILEKPPERVAVVSGTPLNIWYDLGGKSICTSNISANLKLDPQYEKELRALPVVGAVYALDLEAVIGQNPDLIITQAGVQSTATKSLRDMDIPVVATQPRSFEDLIATYRAFGRILQVDDLAEKKIDTLTKERQHFIDQAPSEGKRIAILYLTSNTLAVKLNTSIAGDIAKSLKAQNIAADLAPETIGSENTPLDIEYLVEQNPDLILVTSMIGSNSLAQDTMKTLFADNQAWQSVEAVAKGRVYYLPQEYFLYNAGPYYLEAVRYMACTLYPEVFGEVADWYGK